VKARNCEQSSQFNNYSRKLVGTMLPIEASSQGDTRGKTQKWHFNINIDSIFFNLSMIFIARELVCPKIFLLVGPVPYLTTIFAPMS